MEEEAGIPECSVCLQPYDSSIIVPRVLSCGHSLCEFCISSLALCDEHDEGHGRSLLRCPECNQRSKLQGLPKNFALLQFIGAAAAPEPTISTHQEAVERGRRAKPPPSSHQRPSFVFEASIVELCRWIIPQNAAEMRDSPSGQVLLCRGEDTLECTCAAIFVSVVEAGSLLKGGRSKLKYRQKVQSCLEGLTAHEIKDLLHLLRVQEGVFGIWMDVELDCLYLVHKALTECAQLDGFLKDDHTLRLSNAFLKRSMEICEVFMRLHNQRVVAGLVTPLCLGSSDFLHVQLNMGALLSARNLFKLSVKADDPAAAETLSKDELSQSIDRFPFFYASPEFLMGMRKCDTLSRCDIACKTDSWTLACLFCKYLLGSTPWDGFTLEDFLEKSTHGMQHAQSWIRHHLDLDTADGDSSGGGVHMDFVRTLVRCFSCSPNDRPCISEIWHLLNCMENSSNTAVVSSATGDSTMCCDAGAGASATLWCLALGCTINTTTREDIAEKQDSSDPCVGVPCRAEEGEVAKVQKSGILEGHSGDITCLAVCGQYLLSASLDKTICVWSLRDDTLIKSLKGHTQKVMALATDEQMSVFISGDYGGELFAWDIESTATSCLSKWYHHQDWRYSGVASLAISVDSQLYSGAGDKTIKVWSLQDFGLITIMEGHKSLVSALLVDKEVLYSGSWDGTIRLWWRRDHCPLAVLNETRKLGAVLALASSAELLLVGYQSGRLQVWKDETCVNSIAAHESSISSLCSYQDKLYSGSWDESIKAWKVDELLDDVIPTIVAKCGSAIKALVCYDERLFVGLSSKTISVFTKKAGSAHTPNFL